MSRKEWELDVMVPTCHSSTREGVKMKEGGGQEGGRKKERRKEIK